MSELDWKPLSLRRLSKIEVAYSMAPSLSQAHLGILRIEYLGLYRPGSAGNPDADYMEAMGMAGIAAFAPSGVIHDLSALAYSWGDRLDVIFAVGEPMALVVGPKCRKAVGTLLHGPRSKLPATTAPWVFADAQQAHQFISGMIDETDETDEIDAG